MAGPVTGLLRAWSDGDESALEQLLPLVDAELRRLAGAYMRRERPGHTLQATALVNEAFIRFVDAKQIRWNDRAHFLGIAARSAVLFTVVGLFEELPGATRASGNQLVASYSTKTGQTRMITDGGRPQYLAGGYLLIGREGALWAAPFDVAKLAMKRRGRLSKGSRSTQADSRCSASPPTARSRTFLVRPAETASSDG